VKEVEWRRLEEDSEFLGARQIGKKERRIWWRAS